VIEDRYEVTEPLGAGGMGAVYRAHDRLVDRTVGVKTLRVLDDRQQALLLREARLLNSLSSHADHGFVRQHRGREPCGVNVPPAGTVHIDVPSTLVSPCACRLELPIRTATR
jgi:serine/threonine protein kinase